MATDRDHKSKDREIFWLRATLAVAVFSFLVSAGIAIWGILDARANSDRFTQELASKEAELSKAQADNDALMNVSLPGFLQKYDEHISELKKASDAYEKAKTAKGANVSGSEAAAALTRTENDLFAATDKFTDYIDRWRTVAQSLNNLLDGNVTQLENSRRENNSDDVSTMAKRIVRSAPDLAAPLRVALDRLKAPTKSIK